MSKVYITISLLLVLTWMAIIFFLSEMPTKESNGYSMKIVNKIVEDTVQTSTENIEENKVDVEKTKTKQEDSNKEEINILFRKFAHAGVYLVLGILVLNLFAQIKGKLNIKLGILGIIYCAVYACTDEFHQLFVNGRTGQFLDVGIDTIGAIIGVLFLYLIIKHKENRANAR